MAFPTIDILRSFQLIIVVLGIIIIYFAAKGYRRTKSKSLLFLALGFMFVTIGAVLAGVLFELLNFDLETVETIVAGSEVLGFLLIVYSILGVRS